MWRNPWGRAVAVILLAAVLVLFGRQVVSQWSALAAYRETLHPAWAMVALSGLVVMASYAVLIETWRRTVGAWGERIGWGDAARIWFVSNLGRYIPGKVWQIGAMGVLSKEAGLSAVAAVGSSLVVNVVNILAACLVIVVAGARSVTRGGFLPLTAAATAAALATPWILPPLVRLVNRITRRALPEPHIPPSAIMLALVGCAIAWALYGVAFELLAAALFGVAAGTTSAYIAAFTLSYLVGYLVLFAPGGIGAREMMLTSLLGAAGLESGSAATLLVLVSRLWLTILEAAPGLLILAAHRVRPTTELPNGPQTDRSRSA